MKHKCGQQRVKPKETHIQKTTGERGKPKKRLIAFNVLRKIYFICCELWPNLLLESSQFYLYNLKSTEAVKFVQHTECMLNDIRLYLLTDDAISSYIFFFLMNYLKGQFLPK